MTDFNAFFEPRSIAVVGVSDDAARAGSQAVLTLQKHGYGGNIYPINPKYPSYQGLRCYPSVMDIEGDVDLVVIGVPAQGVLPVLESCALKRIPFGVILSGGFRESGADGLQLEQRLLDIARSSGMRFIGPNCLGYVNVHANVYAAFGSMTRAPKLQPGGVSLVSQSGGFGYSMVLACADAGIGFRHVIATGNESDLDTVELIDALLDDRETKVILSYIEGIKDGRRLLEVGRRALALGKALLLWKGGVTGQGMRAAASHTASMTGSYDFYRAVFKQVGIVEIREIHEVVDYLKVLSSDRLPVGRGVAVIGVSGGAAIAFADAAEPEGLRLCEFDPHTDAALARLVPDLGASHNPVDLSTGYFTPRNQEKFSATVKAVLDDANVAALCVNIATTGKAGSVLAAEVLCPIAGATQKPMVIFASAPALEIADALAMYAAAKVPVLPSPGRAARALAMLTRLREARLRWQDEVARTVAPTPAVDLPRLTAAAGALSEADSKAILQAIGIPVSKDVVLVENDISIFDRMNAPLVVKIVSPDIAHKTEAGAVKVGISTAIELAAALREVRANALRYKPAARIEGVMVSEMVRNGFELIAGVVNDPVFGPVVVVGAGGIHAEILKDSSCRIAPFDRQVAHQMLDELRCRPILAGTRGAAPLDVDSVARALAALSQFAWQHRDRVQEVDINPLFVLADGVVAADALVVLRAVQ